MKRFILFTSLFCLQTLAAVATSIYDLPLKTITGSDVTLSDYKGKTLLIVNVASRCGLTKQYAGLEALYQKYKDRGLVVLGFPCNQFGGQEPGTNEEIVEFCSSKFNVSFPLFDKIEVNGDNRAPLYAQLADPSSPFPGKIKWNFTKFLIGPDGTILQRFAPRVAPDSPEMIAAIEAALPANYTSDTEAVNEPSSQVSPEFAERIAVLHQMLEQLEEAEPADTVSNPHAERQQDPALIKAAIQELKEGKDICTRCLMACGGAS